MTGLMPRVSFQLTLAGHPPKGQKGEASLAAGLGLLLLLQSRHQRWKNTLRMWPLESGFWNLAGSPWYGVFSGSLVSLALFGAGAQSGPVI